MRYLMWLLQIPKLLLAKTGFFYDEWTFTVGSHQIKLGETAMIDPNGQRIVVFSKTKTTFTAYMKKWNGI